MPSIVHRFRATGRNVVRKVRQVGAIGTARHCLLKSVSICKQLLSARESSIDAFDLKYGTDTGIGVSVGDLDIPESKLDHTNRYEAVTPRTFLEILQNLDIRHEDFAFIDIGSGKGRALLLAAGFPFNAVIGVEISRALTEIALNNIRIFKDDTQRCRNLQAFCTDATTYRLPPGKAVVYLYNPFDEHVMQIVLAHIEKSLQALNRKLYVIYQMPIHRNVWDNSPYFRLIKDINWCVFYESTTV